MKIKPLRNDLKKYLKNHQLIKKFDKQRSLFETDPFHRSLNTEVLQPKRLRLYSFRIDQKYRAIFVIIGGDAEIVDINKHYE